ncbi:DsbA family protein [Vibrio sp. Vb2110]|uniref:DsbA family protein n=1 Tax=Vibrio TaxID=662 RepID=UPI000542E6BD|nr:MULTISPECIES: DsbA family protein [Vibrio]EHR5764733.1 DsbA family protein [Vibrio parahaemolyticus]EHY0932572.1 DsbA family protein [Vibrio parahaemolyticus]EIZ0312358.1 DsbA family protein [Vibrio parahaemolyticus]EJE8515927.1 DsbA family protein [Vibrio parahaemolyticus]EJE8774723.1 DsbA family protein [Vibrio parahaemolyticus]
MKFNKLVTVFVSASLVSPLAFATTVKNEKIYDIVEILNENPSIVDELHKSLEMYVQFRDQFDTTLITEHDYMYNNPKHSSFGANKPKLTIINFTDYSCPFCKQLDPVLEQIVEKYPEEVKVVNIYVPLKEEASGNTSAGFALNVWNDHPDKYQDVHDLLVKKPGVHNERSVEMIAEKFGLEEYLDVSPQHKDMLAKNYQLFNQLGIRGTPGLLLNGEIIPGYLPFEKLEPVVLDKIKAAETKQ